MTIFLEILTFLIAAFDAQQDFMPTRDLFFLSISDISKKCMFFFRQQFAKVEHTICDCN